MPTTHVRIGEALEGDATHGTARHPLIYRGLQPHNNKQLHLFEAKHNARGRISRPLSSKNERLCPTASINPEDKIECEDLGIWAVKRKSKAAKTASSGQHNAREWQVSCQSCVEVVEERVATMNALARREKEARALPPTQA